MAERNLKLTAPIQRGSDVRLLQEQFQAHGFDPGIADGVFGKKTDGAVRAFQAGHALVADGVVGPLTRAALSIMEVKPQQGSLIYEFLAWLCQQVGHIYVWGAQGETVTDVNWIYKKETTAYNGARAVTLYLKRLDEGKSPIKAYDCSGLIMRFLEDRQLVSYDHSSRALYGKSIKLDRAELQPGDLVFRHNGVKIYHVGVYMGDGQVIESKGRDDGVVLRGINASGERYWNRYGRLEYLVGGERKNE